MKTKIWKAALAIALTMTCSTVWGAGFVRIDDTSSGTPIVTTDLLGGSFVNPNGPATITLANEQATITGFLFTPTLILPLGSQRSVIFQEPFNTQASDFVTLTVSDFSGGPTTGFYQLVTVFFQSEGAAGFATNVATLPGLRGTVTENGSFQDIMGVLGSAPLQVLVRSEEEGPTTIPEPASLLLFGFGLVGIAGIGRKVGK